MRRIMLVAAGLAALGLASSAIAQQAGQGQSLRQACAADFQKYCAGTPAAGGQRLKCLEDNKDKLSDACRSGLAAVSQAGATMREACGPDIQKLCPSADSPGARMRCITDNKDKLSDACKSAMAAVPQRGGRQGD